MLLGYVLSVIQVKVCSFCSQSCYYVHSLYYFFDVMSTQGSQ